MDDIDIRQLLANLGLGGLGLGGFIWALYERFQKLKVQAATNDSTISMAEAQESVFRMLTGRLETLEVEVRTLREELQTERARRREQELHIFKLEGIMRKADLTPPEFLPGA